MSRPLARAATVSSVASSVLLTVLLTAGPALAVDNDLGPREGADTGAGVSLATTLLIYVVLPLVILLGIAALVWLPGMVKADRYRPQKGWSAAPVWFAGPPDPVAAVETADVRGSGRGGARGDW